MVDILAVGAHPDDIEFGCGGILARMAAEGKSIVMADLTIGEKGTYGSPEIRRKEAEESSKIIGAQRVILDFEDCKVIDTYEGRLKLVKLIRECKPKLILGPLWKGEQSHPDHFGCGLMLRYACRYARFKNILPEIPVHTPEGILHYTGPIDDVVDFIVDVSDYVDTWKMMMQSHISQVHAQNYLEWNLKKASLLGVMIGKNYAQGLVKGNPVYVNDLMAIAKGTREI